MLHLSNHWVLKPNTAKTIANQKKDAAKKEGEKACCCHMTKKKEKE